MVANPTQRQTKALPPRGASYGSARWGSWAAP